MTQEFILANARLILSDTVICGAICIRDGMIAAIDEGSAVPKGALDVGGDFVAPGLIELHTDNLERHMQPRPKVVWPHRAAIVAHDREMAGTGVTTVYDAIRVGSIVSDGSYRKYARDMADEIIGMRDAGAMRVSHMLHLRAELCSETLLDELSAFGPADRVGIVSLMDHTPGQRQFTDIAKYKAYVTGKHGMEEAQLDGYIGFLRDLQAKNVARHEAAAVQAAAHFGATLASHDDTTEAHVKKSYELGVALAEFPTTQTAANACHALGLATIMGAPNLVRGGSHSGNVAALALAQSDRLDILSSDYVPAALLMAAVQLGDVWGDMARGLATVTSTPARAVGLTDRGKLEVGNRADLIRFGLSDNVPILNGTWHQGERVA